MKYLQRCMGCGYEAVLPANSACNSCFDFPAYAHMVMAVPFNQISAEKEPVTDQLSLFGGLK